jgi:hypothetical protein
MTPLDAALKLAAEARSEGRLRTHEREEGVRVHTGPNGYQKLAASLKTHKQGVRRRIRVGRRVFQTTREARAKLHISSGKFYAMIRDGRARYVVKSGS